MSFRIIADVFETSFGSVGVKMTALALAQFADENGSCFPSVKTLSSLTEQSDKTVRRQLDELEERGFLTRNRVRRSDGSLGVYRYLLDPQGMHRNEPAVNLTGGEPAVIQGYPSGHHDRAEPVNEPTNITPSLRSGVTREPKPADLFAGVLDEEHSQAIIAHRKAMKCPLTPHAAKLLCKELAQWPNPNEAADIMIEAGWRGFKADWARNRVDCAPRGLAPRSGGGVRKGRAAIGLEMLVEMNRNTTENGYDYERNIDL